MNEKPLHLILLTLIPTLLYMSAIQTPYYYDDYYHFVENHRVLHPKSLSDIFHNGRQETRPIYNLSLTLQNKFFGTDSAVAHASNVFLHIAAGVVLYFLLLRLVGIPWVAFFTALVFLIHPLSVESVVYFNSRSGLLALLFSLFALGSLGSSRKWMFWIALLSLILAMGSKEDAIATVGIAFLFEFWKGSRGDPKWGASKFVCIAATALSLPVLYFFFRSPHVETVGFEVQSPLVYFWRQGVEIPLHLSLFLWPFPLTLDRDLSTWLFQPLLVLLGWGFIIFAVFLASRHRRSIISLGFLWSLLALLPTHSLIPLLDLEAPRILYSTLPGMSLMFVGTIYKTRERFPVTAKVVFALFLCFFVVRASGHIRIWRDPVALWTKDVEAAPSRWRAWANLAIELGERGKWKDATNAIERAEALAPEQPSVLYNSAVIWGTRPDSLRNEKLAEEKLHKVLQAQPDHVRAKWLLKNCRTQRHRIRFHNHETDFDYWIVGVRRLSYRKIFCDFGLPVVGIDEIPPNEVVRNYLSDFLTCDISEDEEVVPFLREQEVVGVIHCAAKCLVGESVEKPELYEDYNVRRSTLFLNALEESDVERIVFSSTAAVYGEPVSTPIKESHPKKPINPYGKTKLKFENELLKYHEQERLKVGILRYFNAAGADPETEIGETHEPETHLIPNALFAALGKKGPLKIYGDDYSTRDGTCERDYVHVWDLALAHLLLLRKLESSSEANIFNLGSRVGYTIKEVVHEIDAQFGKPTPHTIAPRRPGDPAVLVADPSHAKQVLKWEPKYSDLTTIISTALQWHKGT